jgi:murein DD-endopeptidase MepM/ murein hydrolase activator NlpD
VVILAFVAVTFAARFPTSSNAEELTLVPSFSLSGVSGGTGQLAAATFFRTGSSYQTRDSVRALTAEADVASIRAAGGVSPVSALSSGLAAAAASSGEAGAGVKPLADIVDPRQPFVLYEPQPGDSASAIVQKFGISLRTLLDNNPTVTNKDLLQRGQQLVVPRKDGILYKIGHGDTVDSIVSQYDNVTTGIVLEYRPNAITDPKNLKAGEYILLPGATVKPPPPPPPPPPRSPGSGPGVGSNPGGSSPAAGGAGKFRMPLSGWRSVSDAFGTPRGAGTYHTGIDLDLYGYAFTSVFAACDGVVSRTEYLTYSYGYHVVVDCGDGWSTLYAHFSEISVSPGQRVSAGTVLGKSGLTGFTTGHHLHFEIRKNGAPVNPADYLPF